MKRQIKLALTIGAAWVLVLLFAIEFKSRTALVLLPLLAAVGAFYSGLWTWREIKSGKYDSQPQTKVKKSK